MSKEFKLCYIDGSAAYFTTQNVEDQWGDDWNDAPYEHNAGSPYTPTIYYKTTGEEKSSRDWNEDGTPKWEIKKIYFEADLEEPSDNFSNSPYSVEQINSGVVAWLKPNTWSKHKEFIYAGTTLEDFIKVIKRIEGEVYLPA